MTGISSSTCIRCTEAARSVCEGVVGGGAFVGLPGGRGRSATGVPGEVGGKGPPRKGESTRSGSLVAAMFQHSNVSQCLNDYGPMVAASGGEFLSTLHLCVGTSEFSGCLKGGQETRLYQKACV